jgi:type VI secretion system protein ImpE
MGMEAREHLQAGRLQEALACLQDAVRKAPADASLRLFLFELESVLGNWEKALRQLQIVGELDSSNLLLAQAFRPAIQCEVLRAEVFAGQRSPLIFGEPEPWISCLVQANQLLASGQVEASRALYEKALEEAPASSGTINGEPFEWIADADSRLGPTLEVILDSKYYWVPFARIRSLETEAPKNLRDLVWACARFTWSNGGDALGLIPVRYAGSERATDNALRLARKTEWTERGENLFVGAGQRMLSTDQGEYPLLEVRQVSVGQALEATAAPVAAKE